MGRRRRSNIRRRLVLPAGRFHVINRGARKLVIFAGDADRTLFVRLMVRFARKWGVRIISWCLIPNHYHLEIEADGPGMSRFMRDLQGTYAMAFNRRHRTSGCVFQGRYRCFGIETPAGLAYVSRYIHANSRDMGLSPEDYGWSSCRSYLGIAPMPEWLYPDAVYEAVRKPGMSDTQAYCEYLAAVPPKRPRATPDPDQFSDWQMERVRRVEEILADREHSVRALLGKTSLSTFVCWAARMVYGIPASAVASYYGFKSEASVHVAVARFQRRVPDPGFLARRAEAILF